MPKNKTPKVKSVRRWTTTLYAGFLAGVLAIFIYGLARHDTDEAVDRNVPGATTGVGRNTLADGP